MRLLSPMMRQDDDALVLVRLCMEEALSDDPRKRPLTVGEITASWSEVNLKETLLLRYGLSEDDAMRACAKTRAAWLEGEPTEWEDAHKQFPATLADVREASMPSLMAKPTVYLFARGEEDARDVQRLLARHCVRVPPERILCAADAPSKADALAALRQRHPDATLRFVDDSPEHLSAVSADLRLLSLVCFFASWGYSTPMQESRVAAMPRVRSLGSSAELGAVLDMPKRDGFRMRV